MNTTQKKVVEFTPMVRYEPEGSATALILLDGEEVGAIEKEVMDVGRCTSEWRTQCYTVTLYSQSSQGSIPTVVVDEERTFGVAGLSHRYSALMGSRTTTGYPTARAALAAAKRWARETLLAAKAAADQEAGLAWTLRHYESKMTTEERIYFEAGRDDTRDSRGLSGELLRAWELGRASR